MATFKGKLEFEDIGAGTWVLVTASGERYTLQGDVPSGLSGRQVKVKGKIKVKVKVKGSHSALD